jgi:hypothetical protein
VPILIGIGRLQILGHRTQNSSMLVGQCKRPPLVPRSKWT